MKKDYIINHRANQGSRDTYIIYNGSDPIMDAIYTLFGIKNHVYESIKTREIKSLLRNIDLCHTAGNVYIAKDTQDKIAQLFLQERGTQALKFGKEKIFTRIDSDKNTVPIIGDLMDITYMHPVV